MLATVLLPISDWEERLVGRRLISSCPTFTHSQGPKVWYSASISTTSNLTPAESSNVSSFLLRLPIELRLHILAKLFEDLKPDEWLSCHHEATPASVMFTCKKLYVESRQVAVYGCTFRYEDLPERCRMLGLHDGNVIRSYQPTK